MEFERYTDRARHVVEGAEDEAQRLDHSEVGTAHLLLSLLHQGNGVAVTALRKLGAPPALLHREIDRRLGRGDASDPGSRPLSLLARTVLELSNAEAMALSHDYIGTEHILLGLLRGEGGIAARALSSAGIEIVQARRQVLEILASPATQKPPATLASLGRSLNAEVSNPVEGIVGRQPDIDRVLQVLSRRARNVALLVGDPGVGKTSVAAGLAQAVVRGEVPERFQGRAVLRLDITALFTDPRHHGRFTEVMAELVQDILRSSDLILFLDNALSVVRTREGQAEALAFFRPVFDVPGVSIVAAAGSADHRRWERDSGLDRRIQPVPVAEPAPEDVLEILRSARQRLVDHHEVVITDEALAAAARLAHGYLPGHALPGAAIDLLDEASTHVRSGPVTPGTTPSVTEEVVTRTAGASAALPVAPLPPVLSPPVPHDPTVWSMS
ncbi:Clp protease N-terminal domain-containing protein [Streptomyces sp. NRRL S-495]|uniref:Clp protease N-terminal domain-containing protein n=1 Tax=Streptomyces sp. NRRL S-495 TaxID=1609133 RepID=UPI00099B8ED3|nr:Clp protease N-terminal domain-containing protein [Streptomyces sp. NRRL S-495]